VPVKFFRSVETSGIRIVLDDPCISIDNSKETWQAYPRTVGERIRYFRIKSNITRVNLAKKSGVAVSIIAKYEDNKISKLNIWILEKLAPQLGIRIADLMLYHGSRIKDIYNYVCPLTTLGQKIRNFRIRHHIQQNNLAKMLGIHKVTLCRYERNVVRAPKKIISRIKILRNKSSSEV